MLPKQLTHADVCQHAPALLLPAQVPDRSAAWTMVGSMQILKCM